MDWVDMDWKSAIAVLRLLIEREVYPACTYDVKPRVCSDKEVMVRIPEEFSDLRELYSTCDGGDWNRLLVQGSKNLKPHPAGLVFAVDADGAPYVVTHANGAVFRWPHGPDDAKIYLAESVDAFLTDIFSPNCRWMTRSWKTTLSQINEFEN